MSDLSEKFASLLVEHKQAYDEGNISKANGLFDQCREIAAGIMKEKSTREEILKSLLNSEDEAINLTAACYLLPIDERTASAHLSKIEQSSVVPEHKITAKYSLSEWQAGRMKDIRSLK